jgi:HSP20 family molecular chaperone IbpA
MKRAPKSAAKVVILENSAPISAETEAIQSRIRQRAFELSQTRPRDANEIYDWIVAESEIISVPPTEVIEKDATVEVKFAVAGVTAGDVHVMVTPDQILLKSEYSHEHDANTGTVHVCDFKSTTVFRSVSLPRAIEVDSVKVAYANGMIQLSAAKQGVEQPKRPAGRKAASKKARVRTP